MLYFVVFLLALVSLYAIFILKKYKKAINEKKRLEIKYCQDNDCSYHAYKIIEAALGIDTQDLFDNKKDSYFFTRKTEIHCLYFLRKSDGSEILIAKTVYDSFGYGLEICNSHELSLIRESLININKSS